MSYKSKEALEHFLHVIKNTDNTFLDPEKVIDEQGRISVRSYSLGNTAMLISAYKQEKQVYEQWLFPYDKELSAPNNSGIFEFDIKKITPVYATKLQMVKDPGSRFVMSGFAILLCGMLLLLLRKSY